MLKVQLVAVVFVQPDQVTREFDPSDAVRVTGVPEAILVLHEVVHALIPGPETVPVPPEFVTATVSGYVGVSSVKVAVALTLAEGVKLQPVVSTLQLPVQRSKVLPAAAVAVRVIGVALASAVVVHVVAQLLIPPTELEMVPVPVPARMASFQRWAAAFLKRISITS